MSAPTISVGVGLGIPADTDMILDDAIRGVLDGDYSLSTGLTDITSESVRASISRGRFSQLWDSFDAGVCNVTMNNEERTFDPAYLSSPYFGFVNPGRDTRIQANGIDIFTGFVDDWDLDYDVSGRSTASMRSTDVLGMFGQLSFTEWTSSATTANGKLGDVCARSEVSWPGADFDFDAGLMTLQADNVSHGSNVKNYCDLIARSELGYLFASADGKLTFRNRAAILSASKATFSSVAVDLPLLAEDGSPTYTEDGELITVEALAIPYYAVRATVGSDVLFYRVSVDREGGTAQTATSVTDAATWRDNYGPPRSLAIPGLLLSTDAQSLSLAEYLVAQYDTPRYRIAEFSVHLHALSADDQDTVLGLDIADVITVEFTPNGISPGITQPVLIQGIRHDISPAQHDITFSLVSAFPPFFRLDDAEYGVLDADAIGF